MHIKLNDNRRNTNVVYDHKTAERITNNKSRHDRGWENCFEKINGIRNWMWKTNGAQAIKPSPSSNWYSNIIEMRIEKFIRKSIYIFSFFLFFFHFFSLFFVLRFCINWLLFSFVLPPSTNNNTLFNIPQVFGFVVRTSVFVLLLFKLHAINLYLCRLRKWNEMRKKKERRNLGRK